MVYQPCRNVTYTNRKNRCGDALEWGALGKKTVKALAAPTLMHKFPRDPVKQATARQGWGGA